MFNLPKNRFKTDFRFNVCLGGIILLDIDVLLAKDPNLKKNYKYFDS